VIAMTIEQQQDGGNGQRGAGALIECGNAIIRAIAQPSLTQLVLRFGLAVPFWRSGVNKWDGFLQLNDVAILLFSSEFQLHLPGGPYSFPRRLSHGVCRGFREILLPILLVLGLATRFAALGLLVMTLSYSSRARWLAAARDLGCHGARHQRHGARAVVTDHLIKQRKG
jgi:putative oxidoreductase